MFVRFVGWVVVNIWRLMVTIRATWRHTKESVPQFWFLTRSRIKQRRALFAKAVSEWWKSFNDTLSISIPFMTLISTIAAVVATVAAIIAIWK